MLGTGIIALAMGVAMVAWGASYTRRAVTDRFGDITPLTMKMSEGTGVVPTWVSGVVLGGYALLGLGALAVLAGLFA